MSNIPGRNGSSINQTLSDSLSSNPVLVVHSGGMSAEDQRAIELVKAVLGDTVVVLSRSGDDPEEEAIPRLFVSRSLYYGLTGIEGFVRTIKNLKERERGIGSNGTRMLA